MLRIRPMASGDPALGYFYVSHEDRSLFLKTSRVPICAMSDRSRDVDLVSEQVSSELNYTGSAIIHREYQVW